MSTNTISDSYEYVPSEFDAHTEKPADFDQLAHRIAQAESYKDWSYILEDYLGLKWKNRKVADHVAIMNLNSARDCPNLGTDHCQVDAEECYAIQTEKQYDTSLNYRRRQEYLWDSIDAETFGRAFIVMVERKRNPVTTLRFSQAGDFRHDGDIIKADRIAEIVGEIGIDVYTYSASDYLDWSHAEHFTVNQSNDHSDYGDRHYTAIPKDVDPEDIEFLDDDAVQCPYDYSDGDIKCGDCKLCVDPDGPDVFIRKH